MSEISQYRWYFSRKKLVYKIYLKFLSVNYLTSNCSELVRKVHITDDQNNDDNFFFPFEAFRVLFKSSIACQRVNA